jgi:hypothetical protein
MFKFNESMIINVLLDILLVISLINKLILHFTSFVPSLKKRMLKQVKTSFFHLKLLTSALKMRFFLCFLGNLK